MSDDELREWSPEALVALIRRLEEDLAAATARIAALEAELARRGGPPKTPQNSSTPPSKGWKGHRPSGEGAKRGPPFGHAGTSRRRAAPDWIVLCHRQAAPGCGADRAPPPPRRVGRAWAGGLPPCRPSVQDPG